MKMSSFLRKYDGQSIEYDASFMSTEAKTFCKDFASVLKTELGSDYQVRVKAGHYDVSGFIIGSDDKCIYVSYSIPRMEMPIDVSAKDAMNGILYREAASSEDYNGGTNHFTSLRMMAYDILAGFYSLREYGRM